jgi:hypothetical protein
VDLKRFFTVKVLGGIVLLLVLRYGAPGAPSMAGNARPTYLKSFWWHRHLAGAGAQAEACGYIFQEDRL